MADSESITSEVSADGVQQLKRSRRALQGHLTKLHDRCRSLMLSVDNAAEVSLLVDSIKERFEQYKQKHLECIAAIGDIDEDAVARLEESYGGANKANTRLVEYASSWVRNLTPVVNSETLADNRSGSADSRASTATRARKARALAALKHQQLIAQHEQQRAIERKQAELNELTRRRQEDELRYQLEAATLVEQLENNDEDADVIAGASFVPGQAAAPSVGLGAPKTVQNEKRLSGEQREPAPVLSKLPGVLSPMNRVDACWTPPQHIEQRQWGCTPAYDVMHTAHDAAVDAPAGSSPKLPGHVKLPRPDLLTFSGDVMSFSSFMHNFIVNIESNVSDNRVRLQYLVQLCSSEPRDMIKNCVLLEHAGYDKAKALLQSRYGQPHVIAQAYIGKLVSGAAIKPNDAKSLLRLSMEMSTAQITLGQLGYDSEINNSGSMRRIVDRLPFHLRKSWANHAYRIQVSGRMATFADLSEFVEVKAHIANSMYGLDICQSSSVSASSDRNRGKGRFTPSSGTAFSTTVSAADSGAVAGPPPETTKGKNEQNSFKCYCCQGDCQTLAQCKRFKDMGYKGRLSYVYKNKLCLNCLKWKHLARDCRLDSRCRVSGCTRKHDTLLHACGSGDKVSHVGDVVRSESAGGVPNICTLIKSGGKVCMRILPVRVLNGDKCIETYAMLDQGADVSLCTNKLARELGLETRPKSFSISTVNGVSHYDDGVETSLQLLSHDKSESVRVGNAWCVPQLPVSLNSMPAITELRQYPHLAGIKLPQAAAHDVSILIGANAPEVFWSLEERRGARREPYAVRSILGWTVVGPLDDRSGNPTGHVNIINSEEESMRRELQKLWSTDFKDTSVNQKTMSVEDKQAYAVMKSTAKLVNGHYEMALPWRVKNVNLPCNKAMALSRLRSLKRKLDKNKNLKEKYEKQVNDYVDKGYATAVGVDDSGTPGKTWYLPHHAVFNPHKPGKVRVVFDAAAKYNGASLNDELLHGPDLANSLVEVLIKFRQEPVAIMADVEGMFNQVRVCDYDTDALRFLWWTTGDTSLPPDVFKMLVHVFGATSSPSSAMFALQRTAEDNADEFNHEAVDTISKNFYVDDLLKSVATIEEADSLVPEVTALLKRGGFRLTKWISNSRDVLRNIPDSEKSPSFVNLDFDDELPADRALGVGWDVNQDTFVFWVKVEKKPYTRRGVLSTAASLFDPLGLVSPVTLKAKLMLQKLCRTQVGWDDEMSDCDIGSWCAWLDELPALMNFQIPRCLKQGHQSASTDNELHIFCDASEQAYGACAYIRVASAGHVTTMLVMGKSRVAPLKPQISVPRLELSAAVVGCQLGCMIERGVELRVARVVFWTDSMITLAYIKNMKTRFKTFVANRLTQIHETTEPEQWRHVPSNMNPADLASRGFSATDTAKLQFWLHGPTFLLGDEKTWPAVNKEDASQAALGEEIRKEGAVNLIEAAGKSNVIRALIDRHSSWYRLRRACAWLLRFKAYCANKYLKKRKELITGHLSVTELEALSD